MYYIDGAGEGGGEAASQLRGRVTAAGHGLLRLLEQCQCDTQVAQLSLSEGSNYVCEQKIGRGKYSEVFLGLNLLNSQKCVVKMLKPSTIFATQSSSRRSIAR